MTVTTSDKQILEAAQSEYERLNRTQTAREMAAYLVGYCGEHRPELAQTFQLILDAGRSNDRS